MERSAIRGFADIATACPAFRYAPYGLLIARILALEQLIACERKHDYHPRDRLPKFLPQSDWLHFILDELMPGCALTQIG